MFHRSFIYPALLVAFACTSLLQAAETSDSLDKVKLRYAFETGDIIRYNIDHRASVRSTIDKTSQEAQTRTESVKAWKVIDVLPNGQIEIIHVVEKIRMKNKLPERTPLTYDSEKDKTPPPGFEDVAKSLGTPLSQTRITPWGKVVKREVKSGSKTPDDAQIVLLLPEEEVAIGDTWDEPHTIKVNLPDNITKSVETRRHYKLIDIQNDVAVIEVTFQVLSPINAKIEAQLVQRLMSGTVRFDMKNGRIDSQKMSVDKRVLGFAGATSSMHYVMQMEERVLTNTAKLPSASEEESKDDIPTVASRKEKKFFLTVTAADARKPL